MELLEYFEINNYLFVNKKEGYSFGDYIADYKKDNIIFHVLKNKGIIHVSLQKEGNLNDISIEYLFLQNTLFTEEEIISKLEKEYPFLIDKMNALSDEDIRNIEKKMVEERFGISL